MARERTFRTSIVLSGAGVVSEVGKSCMSCTAWVEWISRIPTRGWHHQDLEISLHGEPYVPKRYSIMVSEFGKNMVRPVWHTENVLRGKAVPDVPLAVRIVPRDSQCEGGCTVM